jgi:DNA-directed RNA polymerase subunit H (RpoH/RPB5)
MGGSELQQVLKERGVEARFVPKLAEATPGERCIPVANQGGVAESVRRSENTMGGRRVVQAGGTDVRGMVYAVLELAGRIRYAPVALDALKLPAS